MQPLYVLGQPISHSLSPVFQNAALVAAGLPAMYTQREVDAAHMPEVADEVRCGQTLGCNITLPHKSLAASLADETTEAVHVTGVANTWWEHDGRLWADNTDIVGLQMSFAALLVERLPRKAVILGAGGAAQAVLYALSPVVEEVAVVNRTYAHAVSLLAHAKTYLHSTTRVRAYAWPQLEEDAHDVQEAIRHADLVVQTTSLPILKPGDVTPFQLLGLSALGGGEGALLELAYGRNPTVPMRQARAAGARVLDGATMLLHQGARSFERWIGKRPDVSVMRDALAKALERPPHDIAADVPEHVRARWGLSPRQAACGGSVRG